MPTPETANIIRENHGTIIINNYGPPEESQTCRIDSETKQWLIDTANGISVATGNNAYGASTVAREAIHFYRKFYHYKSKLLKYFEAVTSLLNSLP